jgi:hypothetical protein
MSMKAIEVSTRDMLEIEEAIDRNAPIEEIRGLLKKARLYYASEPELQPATTELFKKILWKYIVEK